eukprot:265487-Rhodomonas_salina.2
MYRYKPLDILCKTFITHFINTFRKGGNQRRDSRRTASGDASAMSSRVFVARGGKTTVGRGTQLVSCAENEDIMADLLNMAEKFSSGGSTDYKAMAFKRAAESVRKYPAPIMSGHEAQALQYVGAMTAKRIQTVLDKRPDRRSSTGQRSPENVSSNSVRVQPQQAPPAQKKRPALEPAESDAKKKSRAPNLKALFDAGLLPAGSTVDFAHGLARERATIASDGRISFRDNMFSNPTGFANAAKGNTDGPYITDGWSCVYFNGTPLKTLQKQQSDPSAPSTQSNPLDSYSSSGTSAAPSGASLQPTIRGVLSGGAAEHPPVHIPPPKVKKEVLPKPRTASFALLIGLYRMAKVSPLLGPLYAVVICPEALRMLAITVCASSTIARKHDAPILSELRPETRTCVSRGSGPRRTRQ